MSTDIESWLRLLEEQARQYESMQLSPTDDGVAVIHSGLDLAFHHSLVSGSLVQRAPQPGQAICKACNNKLRNLRQVLDLTAGWGGDGLALAHHGQSVTWLEHHPLVHAILGYSLAQLKISAKYESIASLLHLEAGHALEFLQTLPDQHEYDCIFLDPMFPAHKSGAKPGKELQILQALTDNQDIDACFETALQVARKRVVVKRPLKAPTLSESKPDICYREKSIRFDVYLTH